MTAQRTNAAGRDEDLPFSCRAETLEDGRTLVSASGEIDISTCPGFRSALDQARPESGSLIVDLTDVTYMDSTALAALCVVQRRMAAPLDVIVKERHLRKLLLITGLDLVFRLHGSLDEVYPDNQPSGGGTTTQAA